MAKPLFQTRLNKKATTLLGPPVVPFYPFFGEGVSTKIDYRKKGTLILTSLLDDLAVFEIRFSIPCLSQLVPALFSFRGPRRHLRSISPEI